MKHTTGECNKRMLPKDQVASPSADKVSFGGSLAGGGSGLKKGPWTSAEDAILMEYVKKHGEGNWNAVQKYSGLSRCGKSCRLRWANHLRPNLKKGSFTKEEEQLIIELHSKLGNKWARMASQLPGRTDNEIKNFWNTRIKRRQRAGLPVYPAHLSIATTNENQQGQNIGELSNNVKMQSEGLQGSGYYLPGIIYDNYKPSAGSLSYVPALPGYSFTSISSQGLEYPSYSFVNPLFDRKQLGASETLFSVYLDNIGNELPVIENYLDDTYENISSIFAGSYPYDPDPISKNLAPYDSGSHALVNGNFSTSRPLPGTVKQELPSLQYTETDPSCWFPYPSSHPPETVDMYYLQSPPDSAQSDCSSPRNSGLLEDLLHESQALHSGKKQLPNKSSNSSMVTSGGMIDNSVNSFCNDAACVDCDPISPLGRSAASVFNDYCSPPISSDLMLPAGEIGTTADTVCMDIKPKFDFLRPDAILGGFMAFGDLPNCKIPY